MTNKPDNQKPIDLYAVLKDICVWAATGMCGFVVVNSWNSSLSLQRLEVQMEHVSKREDESQANLKLLTEEVQMIRREQLSRTKDVYDIASIERRLSKTEDDLQSRTNIRWNLPDMVHWAEETAKRNPDWTPATVINRGGN